jgi:hypothetical protein
VDVEENEQEKHMVYILVIVHVVVLVGEAKKVFLE